MKTVPLFLARLASLDYLAYLASPLLALRRVGSSRPHLRIIIFLFAVAAAAADRFAAQPARDPYLFMNMDSICCSTIIKFPKTPKCVRFQAAYRRLIARKPPKLP